MMNSVEITNKKIEGNTLAIILTFDDEKAILQIISHPTNESPLMEVEIFDEKVLENDEDEICDYLNNRLTELTELKYCIFKGMNTFKVQSNQTFDIKKIIDTFNFCILNKYSNILSKRIINIYFLTDEDKKKLKNKGYIFFGV